MDRESILKRTNFVNVAVAIVIEKDDQFLMIREAKSDVYGKLNFPSGKVEVGENLIEAAKREAFEESGLEVEITHLISIYYVNWDDDKGLSVRFNFKAKVIDPKSVPAELAKDVLSTEWKTLDEIKALVEHKELQFRTANAERLAKEVLSGKEFPLEILFAK